MQPVVGPPSVRLGGHAAFVAEPGRVSASVIVSTTTDSGISPRQIAQARFGPELHFAGWPLLDQR